MQAGFAESGDPGKSLHAQTLVIVLMEMHEDPIKPRTIPLHLLRNNGRKGLTAFIVGQPRQDIQKSDQPLRRRPQEYRFKVFRQGTTERHIER